MDQRKQQPSLETALRLLVGGLVAVSLASSQVACSAWQPGPDQRLQQSRFLAARRAADDSRPLFRFAPNPSASASTVAASQLRPDDQVVVGKFRAPAPARIQRQRVASSSQLASQTVGASFRVAEPDALAAEKLVHGIQGASAGPRSVQRSVGAKIMVSDEGLNHPPSKLSADIYGNVAEIVTAPPEAVESDLLYPKSSRFSATNRQP